MKITDKTFLNSQNYPKTTANFQVFRSYDGPRPLITLADMTLDYSGSDTQRRTLAGRQESRSELSGCAFVNSNDVRKL